MGSVINLLTEHNLPHVLKRSKGQIRSSSKGCVFEPHTVCTCRAFLQADEEARRALLYSISCVELKANLARFAGKIECPDNYAAEQFYDLQHTEYKCAHSWSHRKMVLTSPSSRETTSLRAVVKSID